MMCQSLCDLFAYGWTRLGSFLRHEPSYIVSVSFKTSLFQSTVLFVLPPPAVANKLNGARIASYEEEYVHLALRSEAFITSLTYRSRLP
jgi:hypothetical protein